MRSRANPWFGRNKFTQMLKDAELLYTEPHFPLLYYKGYHAIIIGDPVNETVLEKDNYD